MRSSIFWRDRVINPIAAAGKFLHPFHPPEGPYTSFYGTTCHHIVLVNGEISNDPIIE
jgi:hypothetical protein